MTMASECHHEHAGGGDFCPDCGAYLAWDAAEAPTGALAKRGHREKVELTADSPTIVWDEYTGMAAKANGEVELQTRLAAISLREDEPPDKPIRVQAGEKVTVHIRVRNQSKIVDEYILAVAGIKPGWWEIEPPDLYLLPFGVGRRSSYEEEAAVTLKPPRSSEAAARRWPIRVTATSKATGEEVASVALKLDVLPYPEVQLAVEPECSAGRRRGEFTLSVTNAGNDAIEVVLSGKPREDNVRVTFEPKGLQLAAGGTKTAKVIAEATPNLVGRPVDHSITLMALPSGSRPEPQPSLLSFVAKLLAPVTKRGKRAAGGELKKAKQMVPMASIAKVSKTLGLTRPAAAPAETAPATLPSPAANDAEAAKPPSCTCTYRQRALLPWWVGVLLAVAIAIFAYFLLQWLKRVPVPNVKGVYISQARDTVKKGNLHGVEVTMVPPTWKNFDTGRPGHAPIDLIAGDVFRENPKAGTKLAPKSSVSLVTAVTAGTSTVPNLTGLATQPAENVLSRAGLAIGNIQPYPPPKGDVIVRQAPRPGTKIADPGHKIVDVWLGQEVAVPNLVGQPASKAEQGLRSLGLVLGTVRGQPPRYVKAPPVIAGQVPAADKTIQAGSNVNVTLGLPVPTLKGQHLLQARRILHAKGMWLGALTPANPPAADVVVSAKPSAGTVTPFGTHVALRLAAPAQKKGKKKGKSSAGAAKPVPSVAGATAAAAAAAIAKAGDKTRKTYAISAKVPAGRLLSTVPAAGAKVAKGKTVTLVISAGYPEIAAAKGNGIVALNGVTGKVVSRVVSGPQVASEPSWSPSGTDIAYVSGGRIMLTPASGPGGPRALTRGQGFALPTFPSVPTAPAVIAAIDGPAVNADELCFLSVSHPRVSCLTVSGWRLQGEIAWSPDGTKLLVGASRSAPAPATLGLLEFTSKVPFSTRKGDWSAGRLVTPAMGATGVRAAAFAPNGSRLALAEDLGAPFSLALVAPSDLMLTKATTFAAPSPACSVQWRADSKEVLVQTSSALDCSASAGSIYVVDPAHPRALSLLATGVADAVWQPLPGVG